MSTPQRLHVGEFGKALSVDQQGIRPTPHADRDRPLKIDGTLLPLRPNAIRPSANCATPVRSTVVSGRKCRVSPSLQARSR